MNVNKNPHGQTAAVPIVSVDALDVVKFLYEGIVDLYDTSHH
jgi:hypothetical protein